MNLRMLVVRYVLQLCWVLVCERRETGTATMDSERENISVVDGRKETRPESGGAEDRRRNP